MFCITFTSSTSPDTISGTAIAGEVESMETKSKHSTNKDLIIASLSFSIKSPDPDLGARCEDTTLLTKTIRKGTEKPHLKLLHAA